MRLNKDLLYKIVGARIRAARTRRKPPLSQAALARSLGVSRATVVNVEAGRQHPPVHLLWMIAEELGVEPAGLLPRRDEYAAGEKPVRLDARAVAKIEAAANGDAQTRLALQQFIGWAQTEATTMDNEH